MVKLFYDSKNTEYKVLNYKYVDNTTTTHHYYVYLAGVIDIELYICYTGRQLPIGVCRYRIPYNV